MTDSELKNRCLTILSEQVGSVEMERFVMLLNRDVFDYTEWRKTHLYQGLDVEDLAEMARETGARLRQNRMVSL